MFEHCWAITVEGEMLRDLPPGAADNGLAFVSQSGALAEEFIDKANARGLPLTSVVSVGNAVHLGVEDYLAYTEARMRDVGRIATGYVYYVSLKGVTGAATIDLDAVAARIPQIRQHARLPVGVGFGIRDAATARAISGVADAMVIGSRIVQLLEEAPREQAVQYLTDFIAEIRQALDA